MRRLFPKSMIVILMGLILTGCQFALFNPKGFIAAREMQILWFASLLMLVIVLPVIALTLFFAYRYREKNNAAYKPDWAHSHLIEIICWSVPLIIIVVLGRITWVSAHELDPYRPITSKNSPLVINVIAYEWKWLFIYPVQKIATVNFVQLPVNTPIEFLITADGPMNSFQIPQLGGQIYAMAGMKSQLHLIANAEGDYPGLSTNFSGEGFNDMHFIAHISNQTQFDEWVAQVKKTGVPLTPDSYAKFIQKSIHNKVQFFKEVNPNIFDQVVMAPMMPMPKQGAH